MAVAVASGAQDIGIWSEEVGRETSRYPAKENDKASLLLQGSAAAVQLERAETSEPTGSFHHKQRLGGTSGGFLSFIFGTRHHRAGGLWDGGAFKELDDGLGGVFCRQEEQLCGLQCYSCEGEGFLRT